MKQLLCRISSRAMKWNFFQDRWSSVSSALSFAPIYPKTYILVKFRSISGLLNPLENRVFYFHWTPCTTVTVFDLPICREEVGQWNNNVQILTKIVCCIAQGAVPFPFNAGCCPHLENLNFFHVCLDWDIGEMNTLNLMTSG